MLSVSHDWFSLSQILGYLAFAFGVACFLQKNDQRFRAFMLAECIAYAAHFFVLGLMSAVASSLVSVARSAVSIRSRSPWWALFFNLCAIGLGWAYQTDWYSWLPILASCLGTTALFLLQGIPMRVVMLGGTLLWLLHNFIVGSIGGVSLELVIAAVNLSTIYRLSKSRSTGTIAPGC
ncbi:MAG: hypothetical protein RL133_1296 [Pseudomonadota bacterium]